MKLFEYADGEMMAIELAQRLAGELTMALDHSEEVLLMVPGGTTPGPVFDALCAADLDWSRVVVALSDERWVPQAHIRSNGRLVRERLLTDRAAAARFLPLFEKAERPEDVLELLSARLEPLLPVGVLLLGMGADMHTASIFPGAEGTAEALAHDAPLLVPVRAAGLEDVRLTVSARVLNAALSKHIVITGAQKRAALERARGMSPQQAPIAAMLRDARVHWAES